MDKEDKQNYTSDDQMVQEEFQALINDYLSTNHRRKVEIITKAFEFAQNAHKGVRRRSGEPYIMHPLAVARIVCKEIGLGSTSICAALLHDVVEDTEYTTEDISKMFGEKVAIIVDGLTKISSGMFGDDVSEQAENFRKLLLTMSNDIRVILIKIADRLHNMRTLGAMAPAKQYKISGETMYIYAPLAHRLGLFAIKTELEELSFRWENPEVYAEISRKLKETHPLRFDVYENFAKPVIRDLDKLGFKYEIRSREKSVYSIWNKMRSKGIPFDEIYDISAVRIIFEAESGVDEKKRCWDIYSVITDIYKLRPDRIRDWVSRPKSNGYQALHLTVMGPDGQWIEIQIRSRRMDDIAEKGFAAHWKYKEGHIEEDTELDKWLKTIKEILENPSPNALDFLDTIKLNLFAQEIFVFTPKGEIKTLAHGATALDFAYDIHTKVGDHAIGAKVNHKLVPISEVLNSGDQVEILTSKTAKPQADWIKIVTTAKAKSKIEYSLRRQRKKTAVKGEGILMKSFEDAKIELTPTMLDRIVDYYQRENKEDLFYAIGSDEIDLPNRIERLVNLKKTGSDNVLFKYMKQAFQAVTKNEKKPVVAPLRYDPIDKKKTYLLDQDSFQNNFVVAFCCKPVSGDKVFGYVKSGNFVDVHSISCPVGLKLKASHGDRIVNLEWSENAKFPFVSTINLTGLDRIGMLRDISEVLTSNSINVKNLKIDTEGGVFQGHIVLFVQNTAEIRKISKELSQIKGMKSVNRIQQV